jgi:ParB family chromosome partitioning protein
VDNGWSVREIERAAKRVAAGGGLGPAPAKVATKSDPNVKAAETKLMRSLNTSVKIVPARKGAGGKIEIEYYTLDDLDRIFSVILSK